MTASSETTMASTYDTVTYDYTRTDARSYTYDDNGNMIEISSTVSHSLSEDYNTPEVEVEVPKVQVFAYNPWNQLVSYTGADNHTTTYGYDGTGTRVSKAQGNEVIKYYWDRGYIVNEYIDDEISAVNYKWIKKNYILQMVLFIA